VVEFIKEGPDSTRGIEYPQGMRPDEQVNRALDDLRGEYPQIEFFTYDIGRPGDQLGVGSGRVRYARDTVGRRLYTICGDARATR
jgi:hypothetical protein